MNTWLVTKIMNVLATRKIGINMSQSKNIDFDVMSMAHDMGDDFGLEFETLDLIAIEFQISIDEVREILSEGNVD